MTNLVSGGVTIVGIGVNMLTPTFYLTPTVGETPGLTADLIGTPVIAGASDNLAILPTDGALILGILTSFENRLQEGVTTGAVALMGGFRLTYKSGDSVAVGDYVVCATGGEVKKAALPTNARVFAKNATNRTVDVMLMPMLGQAAV